MRQSVHMADAEVLGFVSGLVFGIPPKKKKLFAARSSVNQMRFRFRNWKLFSSRNVS